MHSLKKLFECLARDMWVMPLFGAYKKPFFIAVLLGFLTFAFASALMFTSGYLVSASAVVVSVLVLHIPLMCVQVFGLGRPILSYFERLISHDWVFRVTTLLRTKLYQTLEPQGIFYHASVRLGDSLGLLAEDIGHIQDLYLRSIFPMVIAWLLYLISAIALGFLSIPLMILWLLVLGVVLVLLPLLSVAITGPRQQLIKLYTHELYEDLSDNIRGANDWLYSGRTEEFIESIDTKVAKREKVKSLLIAFDHGRDFILQASFLFIILAIIFWAASAFGGATHIQTDAVNWIAAFSLAFFPLIDAFALVPSAASSGAEKLVTIQRLNSLTNLSDKAANEKYAVHSTAVQDADSDTRAHATIQPPDPHGFTIELKHVSFTYAGSTSPTIDDLSLHIPERTKLMILGASGVGKTTLSMLLRGDLIPDAGSLALGSIPVTDFGDNLSRYLCVVSQDPHLFDLTIAENIRLANPSASDEDLWAVLDAVDLKTLVESLPHKLQARIGESAFTLSGGQRQRLALARALVSDAPVLLFDEATSGLDPFTEQRVISCILSAWRDKTIIFITHHLIMAPAFDEIISLNHGSIEYRGSFEHLGKTNSHFKLLYDLDIANEM